MVMCGALCQISSCADQWSWFEVSLRELHYSFTRSISEPCSKTTHAFEFLGCSVSAVTELLNTEKATFFEGLTFLMVYEKYLQGTNSVRLNSIIQYPLALTAALHRPRDSRGTFSESVCMYLVSTEGGFSTGRLISDGPVLRHGSENDVTVEYL